MVYVCVNVAPPPLLPVIVIDVAATDFTVPFAVFVSGSARPRPRLPTLAMARILVAWSDPPTSV